MKKYLPKAPFMKLRPSLRRCSIPYFLLLIAILSLPLSAEGFMADQIYYKILDDGTSVEVYSFAFSPKNVTIPETINYDGVLYTVTAIGNSAFYNCTSLESIAIPASVENIGGAAFYACKSLASVTFADNSMLKSIGMQSFYHCIGLQEIILPEGLESIGEEAFYFYDPKSQLKNVKFPSSLKSIGKNAFYHSALTSIDIPANVESIGEYAFATCESLTSITFEDGSVLTTIKANTFYNCSALTNIVIPVNVADIEGKAFENCSSLASVTFLSQNPPTTLGTKIFSGTLASNGLDTPKLYFYVPDVSSYSDKLKDNIVGGSNYEFVSTQFKSGDLIYQKLSDGSVQVVGPAAGFSGASLTIPASVKDDNGTVFKVTSIAANAFNTSSLTTVYCLPANPPTLGVNAFPETVQIYVSDVDAYQEAWPTLEENIHSFGSLTLTSGSVIPGRTIELSMILDNKAVCYGFQTDVTLLEGWSLTEVKKSGRTNTDSFSLTFNRANGKIVLFGVKEDAQLTAIEGEVCKLTILTSDDFTAPTTITLSNTLMTLGSSDVSLPATTTTITSIGPGYRFTVDNITYEILTMGETPSVSIVANSLDFETTKLSIPASVNYLDIDFTVTSIGEAAFKNCTPLKYVTIPASVGSVGAQAFADCPNLRGVYCLSEEMPILKIAVDAFNPSSDDFTFYVPKTAIPDYKYAWDNYKDRIQALGTTVNSGLIFAKKENGGPDEIEVIGYTKFLNAEVNIPRDVTIYHYESNYIDNGRVTAIKDNAFYDCDKMLSVKLPGCLEAIGADAFYSCDKLNSIDGLDHVSNIGKGAFTLCSGLTSIVIPASVAVMGEQVFSRSGLVSVTFEATMTKIPENIFDNCVSLKNVTINSSPYVGYELKSIGDNAFLNCKALTSIALPASVNAIGDYAFAGAPLSSVTVPNVDCKAQYTSFGDNTSLKIVNSVIEVQVLTAPQGNSDHGTAKLLTWTVPAGADELKIPELVLEQYQISEFAAEAFASLTDKTLIIGDLKYTITAQPLGDNPGKVILSGHTDGFNPSTLDVQQSILGGLFDVTAIGNDAFIDCSALTEITVEESNPYFSSQNGLLLSADGTELIMCPPGITTIIIPETVTVITASAFDGCDNVATIIIECPTTPSIEGVTFPANATIYVQDTSDYEDNPAWDDIISDTGDNLEQALTVDGPDETPIDANNPTIKLTATVVYDDVPVTWSTDNAEVAVVDGNGNVTLKYVGKVTVTAKCGVFSEEHGLTIYPQDADANWDGLVDVGDPVNIANYAVESFTSLVNWNPEQQWGDFDVDWTRDYWGDFYKRGADINGQTGITFADAAAAVSTILALPSSPASAPRRTPADDAGDTDFGTLVVGACPMQTGENVVLPVYLSSDLDFVALQAEISLPEGMTLVEVKAGSRAENHSLSTRRVDDRTMRVVLFDFNNSTFADNDAPLLLLTVNGDFASDEEIALSDVVASDISSRSYSLGVDSSGETNGVDSVSGSSAVAASCTDGLLIRDAMGCNVMVCTPDGAIVKSFVAASDTETVPLAPGLYIVTISNRSFKLLLK